MTLRPLVVIVTIALEGAAIAAPSAEELFAQGQASFERGDYADAVVKWEESYERSREPELLFNIAQALRLDGRCPDALAVYRRFVAAAPRSDQRPLADEFVRELAAKCGEARAPPDVASPEEGQQPDAHLVEADDEARPTGKIVGLGIVGAGVVSVGAGLYFGHRASSLGDEVTSACRSGCDWAVYGRKEAEGRSAETKQYVLAGIGAAAVIGGAVTYWWSSRERRPAPVAIEPARDGGLITWSGSW